MSGNAISAAASSPTWVRRDLSASRSDAAPWASASQPAAPSWRRARATSRSASATRCMPGVRRTWARNMVPNLPAPMSPTVTGRPAAARARSIACRFMGTILQSRRQRSTAAPARRGHGSKRLEDLLAERAGDVAFDRADDRLAVRPVQGDRGAFLGSLEIDAAARRKPVSLADGLGGGTAIGRAVRRRRTGGALRYHARSREARHRAGGVPRHGRRRVGRVLGDIGRALEPGVPVAHRVADPAAEHVDEAGLVAGSRRLSRRLGLALWRLRRLWGLWRLRGLRHRP